jgi:hypothetical protein
MDQGTEERRDNSDVLETLELLRAEVFDDSDEHLALALGRPTGEIESWLSGAEEIDEDAEMKIHGLARERLGE